MIKIFITTILAIFLLFSTVGVAFAANGRQAPEIKNPTKVTGPHPVTMEEWTEIIRALREEKKIPKSAPDKPFRFRLKRQNLLEL